MVTVRSRSLIGPGSFVRRGGYEKASSFPVDGRSDGSVCRRFENIAGAARPTFQPADPSDRAVRARDPGELQRAIRSAGLPGKRRPETWGSDPGAAAADQWRGRIARWQRRPEPVEP